jgi:putative acyl-CoA dehydrogenase
LTLSGAETASVSDTHEVTNQSPAYENVNLFTSDAALRDAVGREGSRYAIRELSGLGLAFGSAEAFERGRLANENPPKLKTHDRQGRRIDMVEYHPAYHACMEASMGAGLHSSIWQHLATPGKGPKAGANVTRAGAFYMAAQAEAGHCCPITMTSAAVPVLLLQPDLTLEWLTKIIPKTYDQRFAPVSAKRSVTFGMGMTEKQGGTDVRTNTTRAEAVGNGGPGGEYVLTGHKWFMSAPMSDAFLVLAQTQAGPTCFLMPRLLPDGTANGIRLQRLKDKLGNRSNASSEVEFERAHAWAIGEEGRGVASIIEMVTHTRLDCAVASAGLMRLALAHAINHAEHRTVFEKKLIDQPLMGQVLADMALDLEAAVALSFRLARAFDKMADEKFAAWRRLMTPVTKYWVCKIAPAFVFEAMECMGGNGYVEELPLARLYREVPVNAIWEGSGNVMALDVLRVLQREPESFAMVMDELGATAAKDPVLKAAHARIEALLHDPRLLDYCARQLIEALAVLAAGCLLKANAPAEVADAFIWTRFGPSRQTYGQGLERTNTAAILKRASPNEETP